MGVWGQRKVGVRAEPTIHLQLENLGTNPTPSEAAEYRLVASRFLPIQPGRLLPALPLLLLR